jgi:hypothetical protein
MVEAFIFFSFTDLHCNFLTAVLNILRVAETKAILLTQEHTKTFCIN